MDEPVKPLTTAGVLSPLLRAGPGVEKFSRGAGGGLHFFRRTLADAFRLAIAPNVGRENGLVPLVNQIAHGLPDEVRGNRVAGESVLGEQRPFLFYVIRFGEGAVHFKMVAPAGEFHAVVAHFFDERQEFGE